MATVSPEGGGRRFESVRGPCKGAANPDFPLRVELQEVQFAVVMELFMELAGPERAAAVARGQPPIPPGPEEASSTSLSRSHVDALTLAGDDRVHVSPERTPPSRGRS
jgi:hypothetical protein